MAITRRQFVSRLGALAAAAGLGQADVSRITEVFAYGTPAWGGTLGKPRVVWIHGAECTGCSTSLLSTYEDATGTAIYSGKNPFVSTLGAIGLATNDAVTAGSDLTLHPAYNVDSDDQAINIADVLVDIIDLQYHETVMGMGGDLAYQWLKDFMATNDKPFVLVVEGAMQPIDGGGAWGDTGTSVSWCSIGMDGNDGVVHEHDMGATVAALAGSSLCPAVIAIGQCATYGGYPGCKSPLDSVTAGFDTSQSQTGAVGAADFLTTAAPGAQAKVINVPGCPTNPWWFILTVVCWIVDAEKAFAGTLGTGVDADGPLGILAAGGAIKPDHVDYGGRLTYAYPGSVHGSYCTRIGSYNIGEFAEKPGDPGCLQKLGCKGPATKSSCPTHGWNSQQPENASLTVDSGLHALNNETGTAKGGNCTRAGHPCMSCTEKGYPDSFVPFVVRS